MNYPFFGTSPMHPCIKKYKNHSSIQFVEASFDDRRQNERIHINRSVKVMLGGSEICRCVIKDLSASGAKLLVSNSNWVPKEFEIEGLVLNARVPAKKIWMNDQVLGVEFAERNTPRADSKEVRIY